MCIRKIVDRFESWKGTFWYNFKWSNWINFVDGWIPRISIFVPIIGYIIIFNDTVSKAIEFSYITDGSINYFGLTGQQRLKFIYFGLIFLGVSNLIYWIKRPWSFRIATNVTDYVRAGLDLFTLYDFLQIHGQIRSEGHKTIHGKYSDSEWETFTVVANPASAKSTGGWEASRNRFGDLLRSMLQEFFFLQDTRRKIWLLLCVSISSLGYAFLSISSIDLFVKVLLATIPDV